MTLPMILGRRASLPWTDRLIAKLRNQEYRSAFVEEGVKTWIARQIRALRERRGWSQGELGERAGGKPQSAISRIEDPDYGQMNLQTLFEVANAFDVALVVKFVDYPTYLRENKEISQHNMQVASFDPDAFKPYEAQANQNFIILGQPVSAAVRQISTGRVVQPSSIVRLMSSVGATAVVGAVNSNLPPLTHQTRVAGNG